jgi:hypothetical protein
MTNSLLVLGKRITQFFYWECPDVINRYILKNTFRRIKVNNVQSIFFVFNQGVAYEQYFKLGKQKFSIS